MRDWYENTLKGEFGCQPALREWKNPFAIEFEKK